MAKGQWIGGVSQFAIDGVWEGYIVMPDGGDVSKEFWHRRDAKRWVESHPRRQRP